MHSALKYLWALISLLALQGCETNEPENNAQLKLTVEETSCTEAWVKIEYASGFRISLQRDGNEIANFKLTGNDTTIIDETLEPSRTYSYLANVTIFDGNIKAETSARTLDTTSHEYIWAEYLIGDEQSYILDVSIVNENDIWAIGRFYIASDTSYVNAAHWDGNKWELVGIPIRLDYPGGTPIISDAIELRSIFLTDDGILWVSSNAGGASYYKNNKWNYTIIDPPENGVAGYEIWGTNSQNIYLVGYNGRIVNLDGAKFTPYTSVTSVFLSDIYGAQGGEQIWAVGYDWSDGSSVLLRKEGGGFKREWERNSYNSDKPYNHISAGTIWVDERSSVWITGASDGVYQQSYRDLSYVKHHNFGNRNAAYKIRGTDVNNVFLTGDFSMLWHYNGKTWKYYNEIYNESDIMKSLDVKDDIVVLCGHRFTSILTTGLIKIGKKQ